MSKLTITSAALIAASVADPASAADVPLVMPVKAPVPVVEPWSWTGLYVGGRRVRNQTHRLCDLPECNSQ